MPIFEQKPAGSTAILDFVPYRYWPALLNQTSTVDCGDYIQAAFDAASTSRNKTVYLHRGCIFPTSKRIILNGTAYSNITVSGPEQRGYNERAPRIQALNTIAPHATYGDYMLWVNGVDRFGWRNANLHSGGFANSLMWLAYASYGANLENFLFEATTPVIVGDTNSANVPGNTINISGSSGFAVNDRVQVWARVDATLPGLTDGQVLYIKTKSGANISFSTTLGGATLALSGSSAGLWGVQKFHWTVESVASNTVTITNHNLQDGDKVQFSNRSRLTFPYGSVNTSYPALALYVRDQTTNTFKLSLTPGGTAVPLSGHVAGQTVSKIRHGIHGGSLQYGGMNRGWFRNCGAGLVLSQYDAPGGIYVGWDSFTMSDILCNSSAFFLSGRGSIDGLRLEGKLQGGFDTMAAFGADSSSIHVRDMYTELDTGPVKTCAVSVYQCIGSISGWLGGEGSSDTDSIAVVHHNPGFSSQMRIDCFMSGWGRGEYGTTVPGNQPMSKSRQPFTTGNSDTRNCGASSYFWSKGTRTTTGVIEDDLHPTDVRRHRDGREIGDTLYLTHRVSANNPTAIDTRMGHIHDIVASSAHTINTLTDTAAAFPNEGCFGYMGSIIARTAYTTLGTGAFETLSGANLLLTPNQHYGLVANATASKLVVQQALGSVVHPNTFNITAPVGITGIFSGNILAGLYSIEGYIDVSTATTSTGTLTITLGWTDGNGAHTVDLCTAFDVTPGGSRFLDIPVKRFRVVGGSNPTLTITTPAAFDGSPVIVASLPVRRLQ